MAASGCQRNRSRVGQGWMELDTPKMDPEVFFDPCSPLAKTEKGGQLWGGLGSKETATAAPDQEM